MIIRGIRKQGRITVTIDGQSLDVYPSQQVRHHSQEFNWSYSGSGPAQLALAILLAAGATKENAITYHQAFKSEVIAGLKEDAFELDVDIHPSGALWKVKSVKALDVAPIAH